MPFVTIDASPLAPGIGPVQIHYRDTGVGAPILFLHGGWGYQIYPFDRQVEAFGDRFRVIIPDRTGYGRSTRIDQLPTDFHRRAAEETWRLLEALHVERPILWGHSDGAVIAAMMGLAAPGRISALVLEAFHFYRKKPGSREFFETMADDPDLLGERVATRLSSDHGEDYWRKLIVINGRAWLSIAEETAYTGQDFYDGKLSELQVRTLFIHGSRDPRTESGEMDTVRGELPNARIEVIEGGGHSPHSESAVVEDCNRIVKSFLDRT